MAFATDINIHHGANFSAMRTNTSETNAAFKHGLCVPLVTVPIKASSTCRFKPSGPQTTSSRINPFH